MTLPLSLSPSPQAYDTRLLGKAAAANGTTQIVEVDALPEDNAAALDKVTALVGAGGGDEMTPAQNGCVFFFAFLRSFFVLSVTRVRAPRPPHTTTTTGPAKAGPIALFIALSIHPLTPFLFLHTAFTAPPGGSRSAGAWSPPPSWSLT